LINYLTFQLLTTDHRPPITDHRSPITDLRVLRMLILCYIPLMPNQQEILQQAGELLSKGELEQTVRLLEDTLAKNAKLIEVRVLLAKLKAAMGDFESFNRLANEALRVSLSSAESYLLKGMSCGFQRDFDEAIRYYDMALTQNDKIALVHTNMGIARRETGDYSGAEAALRRARQLDPEDPEIGYHLAQTLAMQTQIKEAIDELIATVKLNPLFLPSYLALGAIYTEGEDIENAIEIYRAALSARPDAIEPKVRMANLYLRLQKPQESVELWKQIAIARGEVDDFLQLGLAAIAAQDMQLAEQAFLKSSERAPEAWEPYYNLAELYDVLEMPEPAGRAYEMAVSYNRGSYKPHNGYGLYLLKSGQIEAAVDHLIEAYELSDREPEPPYNLALAFVQAERLDDARQVLTESLAANRLDYLQSNAEKLLAKLTQNT
jgi:tetratricopeptide (TPR) repeat protein